MKNLTAISQIHSQTELPKNILKKLPEEIAIEISIIVHKEIFEDFFIEYADELSEGILKRIA